MAIRIHSFVNENSFGYFDYLIKNYRDMAENPSQLIFEAYLSNTDAPAAQ